MRKMLIPTAILAVSLTACGDSEQQQELKEQAKAWTEEATISPAIGLWWVHGCMLLLTLTLLAVQNGWHRRIFRLAS